MSAHFAYSLDREIFLGKFATRRAAEEAALAAARLQADPPAVVFVGIKNDGDAQVSGHARPAIQRMIDRARTATDQANHYLQHITEMQEADLDSMLAATLAQWLAKHDRLPTFFSVTSISEHTVPTATAAVLE